MNRTNKPRVQADDKPQGDFCVINSGSIFLFCPLTGAAKEWLSEHCSGEEHSYLGPNLAVEHRYIENLIDLALQDGLFPSRR